MVPEYALVHATTYFPSLEQEIPLQVRALLVENHGSYLYKGSYTAVKSCETVAIDVLIERYILPTPDKHATAYNPEEEIDTPRQLPPTESEAVQLCP